MWILKLHVAVSILIILTFIGFRTVMHQVIIDNGWNKDKKHSFWKSKYNPLAYWIFFVPVLRWICLAILFLECFCKKEKFDEFLKKDN